MLYLNKHGDSPMKSQIYFTHWKEIIFPLYHEKTFLSVCQRKQLGNEEVISIKGVAILP